MLIGMAGHVDRPLHCCDRADWEVPAVPPPTEFRHTTARAAARGLEFHSINGFVQRDPMVPRAKESYVLKKRWQEGEPRWRRGRSVRAALFRRERHFLHHHADLATDLRCSAAARRTAVPCRARAAAIRHQGDRGRFPCAFGPRPRAVRQAAPAIQVHRGHNLVKALAHA